MPEIINYPDCVSLAEGHVLNSLGDKFGIERNHWRAISLDGIGFKYLQEGDDYYRKRIMKALGVPEEYINEKPKLKLLTRFQILKNNE